MLLLKIVTADNNIKELITEESANINNVIEIDFLEFINEHILKYVKSNIEQFIVEDNLILTKNNIANFSKNMILNILEELSLRDRLKHGIYKLGAGISVKGHEILNDPTTHHTMYNAISNPSLRNIGFAGATLIGDKIIKKAFATKTVQNALTKIKKNNK
jgi:hypothetical protein